VFFSKTYASSCEIELVNLQGKVLESFQGEEIKKNDRSMAMVLKDQLHTGIYFINLKVKQRLLIHQAFVVL